MGSGVKRAALASFPPLGWHRRPSGRPTPCGVPGLTGVHGPPLGTHRVYTTPSNLSETGYPALYRWGYPVRQKKPYRLPLGTRSPQARAESGRRTPPNEVEKETRLKVPPSVHLGGRAGQKTSRLTPPCPMGSAPCTGRKA